MTLKLFDLNGIDLTPFTRRITDMQATDAEALSELGIEIKSLSESGPGTRTIIWSGIVTDETTYLKLRKEMFGSASKVLKTNASRQMNITGLKAESAIDLNDQAKTGLTLTLFTADPLEYNAVPSTGEVTVTAQGNQITIVNNGEAPTTPDWQITALGTIIDPMLSDSKGNVMAWNGTLNTGDVLKFISSAVLLNDTEIGGIIGQPLRVAPGNNVITYNDSDSSSHSCTLKATWRDAYY